MHRDVNESDRGAVQDRLPDFVLGRLAEPERLAVERAVAADTELARELEFVRAAQRALTPRAVSIDASRVAAALPRPMSRSRGLRVARWRVAAAIATIAVGGAGLAVLQQSFREDGYAPLTIIGSESTPVASAESLSVSFGYDLSELQADELEQLITELENSGGVPTTEPKVTVVISPVEASQ